MQKLMTRYSFSVKQKDDGCYITVVRLLDMVEKVFFLIGNRSVDTLSNFMSSITDEQADGYFPKPKKEKKQLTQTT